MCTHVYLKACLCIYVRTCARICVCAHVYVHRRMHVYKCAYLCMCKRGSIWCTHVHLYTCKYTHTCICMCTWICILTHVYMGVAREHGLVSMPLSELFSSHRSQHTCAQPMSLMLRAGGRDSVWALGKDVKRGSPGEAEPCVISLKGPWARLSHFISPEWPKSGSGLCL